MTRPAYSPIAATFGVRMEQFLESDRDYIKYHQKLNKKLQKLRSNLNISTRDTKRYSSKEKFSKITTEDYDGKNKLFGTLMLLYIERDVALCEMYKLRSRGRGKLKKSERKILTDRLKKAARGVSRLSDLSKNEPDWNIRAQYLIYAKLITVENLLYGKQAKRKETENISQNLAIALAALKFLVTEGKISQDLLDSIRTRYEYTLMQYAGGLLSPIDLHNFITNTVLDTKQAGNDELVNIIYEHGFNIELKDIEMEKNDDTIKHIDWRSFNCTINDNHLAQLIEDARSITTDNISDYSAKVAKWEECLTHQETYISHNAEDIEDEENEQILLAYIKYQTIFTSVSREYDLFNQLWSQWLQMSSLIDDKILKFKELDRIVKNLRKYLQDLMELPGVYSDDELLSQLDLAKLYFTLHITAGCLGHLYQLKHQNVEALALYTDAYKKLTESYEKSQINTEKILLSDDLITKDKVENFITTLKANLSSIIALAEFETEFRNAKKSKYDLSTIDNLSFKKDVSLNDAKLENLFPLRPQLMPIGVKPSLFDMAFNYIQYDNGEGNTKQTTEGVSMQEEKVSAPSISDATVIDDSDNGSSKRRGFLGLFGR